MRRNVGQMTRELRNLASPSAYAPQAVELALPADLVFQTVDPVGPNRRDPMPTARCSPTTPRSRPAVSAVNVDLFVDVDPLRPPGETRLRSGAFLRNQNRAPTAAFAITPAAAGKVVLNGSPSSDPEGQPLTYVWMSSQGGGVPKKLGEGITCECPTDADAFPGQRLDAGSYTLWLEVTDPGGLSTKSATQIVEIS